MKNGTLRNTLKRTLFSILLVFAVVFAGAAILGILIYNGIANDDVVPYALYVILFCVGFVSCVVRVSDSVFLTMAQGVLLPVAILSLMHLIVCDYEVRHFLITTVAVFSGAVVSALIGMKKKRFASKTNNYKMVNLYKKR